MLIELERAKLLSQKYRGPILDLLAQYTRLGSPAEFRNCIDSLKEQNAIIESMQDYLKVQGLLDEYLNLVNSNPIISTSLDTEKSVDVNITNPNITCDDNWIVTNAQCNVCGTERAISMPSDGVRNTYCRSCNEATMWHVKTPSWAIK